MAIGIGMLTVESLNRTMNNAFSPGIKKHVRFTSSISQHTVTISCFHGQETYDYKTDFSSSDAKDPFTGSRLKPSHATSNAVKHFNDLFKDLGVGAEKKVAEENKEAAIVEELTPAQKAKITKAKNLEK